MARARAIDEISAESSYATAAARTIEVRSEELAEQRTGVLDTGDIERVHDMRVATRRLRAALEVFEPCFPRKAHRRTLREVKALADGLGERRDLDVALDALEQFNQQINAPDRRGIESLIGQLRAEQAQANVALAPLVEEERLAALRAGLAELVEAARGRGDEGTSR